MLNITVNHLHNGVDPIKMLDIVIRDYDDQWKRFQEYIEKGPPPQYVLKSWTFEKVLDYEISGCWWASLVPFGHGITSRLMLRRTKRKMALLMDFEMNKYKLNQTKNNQS
mgnify:CR=1 FL=1